MNSFNQSFLAQGWPSKSGSKVAMTYAGKLIEQSWIGIEKIGEVDEGEADSAGMSDRDPNKLTILAAHGGHKGDALLC